MNSSPPKLIPAVSYNDFTLNGSIPISYHYFDHIKLSQNSNYTNQDINNFIQDAENGVTKYYGKTDVFLFDALKKFKITDQHCGFIGSQTPWYESIALAYGASLCTTIEYQNIHFDHPQIKTIKPEEYDNKPIQFDCVISISSIEHDGLGRYGDPINPYGDIDIMNKLKKMIKTNGLLFIAIPIGKDELVWNAHRIYGSIRLPMLFQNWKILDSFGFCQSSLYANNDSHLQPVFILQNI